MKKVEWALIVLASLLTFVLVYSPHFSYPWPLHADEWHHITEAKKLGAGEYSWGSIGYRFGFHVILLGLSKIIDLVSVYQFLPAIWAVISGLTLFYVVNKKTKNFWIAFFALFFFASLKSNVNILGLWFFTPLTFSIPFIFLYIYWFSEGFALHNKKYLLFSLGIMLFLVFVYPLSVLFALPFLLVYSLWHFSFIKKEWKFFSIFLLVPIAGLALFAYMNNLSFFITIGSLLDSLIFSKEWGVLVFDNSFLEIYSLIGYALAGVGFFALLLNKKGKFNSSYIIYLLWPLLVLVSIFIFYIFDVSFLVPYQRNLYYFVLSMPLLSAYGLTALLSKLRSFVSDSGKYAIRILLILVAIIVLFFSFLFYYSIPGKVGVYHVIDEQDYRALRYLSSLEKGRVMATAEVSTAVYVLTGNRPVASLYFYGDRNVLEQFFDGDCALKNEIARRERVKYIFTSEKMECGWKLLYDEQRYIYRV